MLGENNTIDTFVALDLWWPKYKLWFFDCYHFFPKFQLENWKLMIGQCIFMSIWYGSNPSFSIPISNSLPMCTHEPFPHISNSLLEVVSPPLGHVVLYLNSISCYLPLLKMIVIMGIKTTRAKGFISTQNSNTNYGKVSLNIIPKIKHENQI